MKNSRKREVALVASGIVLGAAITAPAAGAALTAQQSNQKIVVDGKPAQIEAYSINGNNYVKIRDLGKAVGFHALRHTFATRSLEQGMDVVTLSRLLGHANPSITMDKYGHALEDHKRSSVQKLRQIYGKPSRHGAER